MAIAASARAGISGLARRTFGARGGAFAMLQTLLAQGMTMGVNLATGILTARLLGPEGRGDFAAANMWLLLPSFLAVSGIMSGIVYAARLDPTRRAAVGLAGLIQSFVVFVPLALIAWFAMPTLMHHYNSDVIALARLCLLAAYVNVVTVVTKQSFLAEQDFRSYNLQASAFSVLYLVLLVGLAVAGLITPKTAIWAQIVGTVLVAIIGGVRLLRGWRGLSWNMAGVMRPLLSYSLRAATIDVVAVLTGNIDRLVLVRIVSPAEFGLYAVALSFARIVLILQTAISAVTLADLTGKGRAEAEAFLHRTFRMLAMLLVVACGLVLLVDRQLLLLAYGSGFDRAVPIFRVLLIDAALTCMCQVLMQVFLARGRPSLASGAQVASFVATGVGVAVLAVPFGAIGAAMALVGGGAVRLGVLLFLLPRIELARPSPLPRWSDLTLVLDRLRPMLPRGSL